MADGHQGYGAPIGGVFASKDAIVVNFVGVDIGCGMLAVQTTLTEIPIETLTKILEVIRRRIPVGMNHHKAQCDDSKMPDLFDVKYMDRSIVCEQYERAKYQMGTLGGGNHFIEIQKGDDGHIWFMIHSGSRNLGYKVAKHYNKLAQELCTKWYSKVPPFKGEDGLAFFPIGTDEADDYLAEMEYCLDFAKRNREQMAYWIKDIIKNCMNKYEGVNTGFDQEINIHHNYATIENHFGKNVWIHRKGATSAKLGELGIIPGSQGTSSYIVRGKGERESFTSCSHGAGRAMSRNDAKRTLDLEAEQTLLNNRGILNKLTAETLDEASGAYKDIDVVMKEQADLVDIVVKLDPLAVIKG